MYLVSYPGSFLCSMLAFCLCNRAFPHSRVASMPLRISIPGSYSLEWQVIPTLALSSASAPTQASCHVSCGSIRKVDSYQRLSFVIRCAQPGCHALAYEPACGSGFNRSSHLCISEVLLLGTLMWRLVSVPHRFFGLSFLWSFCPVRRE